MRAYTAKGDQEKVMSPMNNGLIGFVNLFTENRPSDSRRPPRSIHIMHTKFKSGLFVVATLSYPFVLQVL